MLGIVSCAFNGFTGSGAYLSCRCPSEALGLASSRILKRASSVCSPCWLKNPSPGLATFPRSEHSSALDGWRMDLRLEVGAPCACETNG